MMIDNNHGAESQQFMLVSAKPVFVTAVQADGENILSRLGCKFDDSVYIGLHLRTTGEKPIQLRHRFFKKTKHLFAHALENIRQPEH